MSATGERAQAYKAAEEGDFETALSLAEKVSEAWYRCQSLAAVARYAPDAEVARVANKALKAAQEAGDAYKRVAVCAWPVAALVERGKNEQMQKVLAALIEEAAQITPPVSKVIALHGVWEAAWPLPINLKQPVLDALLAACRADNSWKAGRILSWVVLVVASDNKQQAQYIISSMRDGPYRRRAQKRLDAGQTETVRSFFHRPTAQENAEYAERFKKREAEWEERDKKRAEKRAKLRAKLTRKRPPIQ